MKIPLDCRIYQINVNVSVLSFVICETCTQKYIDRKKLPQFRHRLPPGILHVIYCSEQSWTDTQADLVSGSPGLYFL